MRHDVSLAALSSSHNNSHDDQVQEGLQQCTDVIGFIDSDNSNEFHGFVASPMVNEIDSTSVGYIDECTLNACGSNVGLSSNKGLEPVSTNPSSSNANASAREDGFPLSRAVNARSVVCLHQAP
ncbi:hypothetical protein V6N13_041444 [Hibiscus sabdariffa]